MTPPKPFLYALPLLLLLLPTASLAQRQSPPPPSSDRDAEMYCRYVTGSASSDEALLVSPVLFAEGGLIGGADDPVNTGVALPPQTRVIAGAQYSLSTLYRGLQTSARADADCERYRAVSELHAFVEANRDGTSRDALSAKVAVFEGAQARAQEILTWTRAAMMAGRVTVEQMNATQLRVEQLHELGAEARQQLDTLATAPVMPKRSVAEIIRVHDEAESKVERYNARIRESFGWDLSVKGGYDQIFNLRNITPYFALATLTLNIGWLFQQAPDARAIEAHGLSARAEVEGVDDRATQLMTRLRAIQRTEQARLKENETLLADLEARVKDAQAVAGGDQARQFLDIVWFDLIRVRADHEYLRVHVHDLNEMLRDAK